MKTAQWSTLFLFSSTWLKHVPSPQSPWRGPTSPYHTDSPPLEISPFSPNDSFGFLGSYLRPTPSSHRRLLKGDGAPHPQHPFSAHISADEAPPVPPSQPCSSKEVPQAVTSEVILPVLRRYKPPRQEGKEHFPTFFHQMHMLHSYYSLGQTLLQHCHP